jgi:hypothetical protein
MRRATFKNFCIEGLVEAKSSSFERLAPNVAP